MLVAWLGGSTVPDLLDRFGIPAKKIESLGQFVEDYFSYRLPWGFSAYLHVAYRCLSIEEATVPPRIRYLPSMVRFGVGDPVAAWALASAIPTREAANAVGRAFAKLGLEQTPQTFLKWLGRVDLHEVTDSMEIGINYKPDVVQAVVQSGVNELLQQFTGAHDALPRVTEVRGVTYGDRSRVAKSIGVDTVVQLVRE